MKLILERCSVVLVGAWNLAIFNPDWVGRRLFPEEHEVAFEVTYALGLGAVSTYRVPGAVLGASAGRLDIKPADATDASFERVEDVSKSILRLLPETPLRGCGVNFGFDAQVRDLLQAALTPGDSGALASVSSVSAARVQRRIVYADTAFNLSVRHDSAEPIVNLDINRHFDTGRADETATALDQQVLRTRALAEEFLTRVYGSNP